MGLIVSLVAVAVIVACFSVLAPRPGVSSQVNNVAEQVSVQALSLGEGVHSLLGFKETRVVAASAADARAVANYLTDQLDADMGDGALGTPSARDGDGRTAYVFPQTIEGVPVYGREAVLTVDDDGYAVAMAATLEDFKTTPDVMHEVSDDDAQAKMEEVEPGANVKLLGLYLLALDQSYETAYLFEVDDPEVDKALIYAVSAEDGEVLGTMEKTQDVSDVTVDEDHDERLKNLIDLLISADPEGDDFSEDEAKTLVDSAEQGLPTDSEYDMLIAMLNLLSGDLDEGRAKRLESALKEAGVEGLEVKEADATKLPKRFVDTGQEQAAVEDEDTKDEKVAHDTSDEALVISAADGYKEVVAHYAEACGTHGYSTCADGNSWPVGLIYARVVDILNSDSHNLLLIYRTADEDGADTASGRPLCHFEVWSDSGGKAECLYQNTYEIDQWGGIDITLFSYDGDGRRLYVDSQEAEQYGGTEGIFGRGYDGPLTFELQANYGKDGPVGPLYWDYLNTLTDDTMRQLGL